MAITGPIPLPGEPGEAFIHGATSGHNMINDILKRRQEQLANQQLNDYRMGQLGIEQQKLPSAIDLQKAQAAHQYAQANYEKSPERYDLLKAQAESARQLAKHRSEVGEEGRGSKSAQLNDIMALGKMIMQDNPGISMQEANQLADAHLSGSQTLPNGQPITPLGGRAASLADQILGRRTTTALTNQAVNASQSEAELDVLDKYAQKGLEPYGDTYLNMNPQQIVDTFKSDKESQERLGKFIGSQALQFEIAQIRNRIAMGQPGITSTQEMMNMSHQIIDAKFPMLSGRARQAASNYVNEALKEGLEARKKIGVNKSVAFRKPEENRKESNLNEKTEQNNESDIDRGRITIIDSNRKEHKIARDKLDDARKRDPGLRVKKEPFSAARI